MTVKGPDRLGRTHRLVQRTVKLDLITRQVRREAFAHSDNCVAGTAAAVWNRPRFVQIIMHRVDAERTEVHPTGDGIHICAVHVNQTSDRVDLLGDLLERSLENATGVRIGDHDPCDPIAVFRNTKIQVIIQHAPFSVGI